MTDIDLSTFDPRLNGKIIPMSGRVQVDAVALGKLHEELDFLRLALAATVEKCAKVCETMQVLHEDQYGGWQAVSGNAGELAVAIRATSPASLDEVRKMREDAILGEIAACYIDRMIDPVPSDPLGKTVGEFVTKFHDAIDEARRGK